MATTSSGRPYWRGQAQRLIRRLYYRASRRSLRWRPRKAGKWQKEQGKKFDNFVLYNSLAEDGALAALRTTAACVSGIVLEGGAQKQQGAEDKQAIRDSLNTATLASTVEGCEDLRSNRAINPPSTSWSRHLSAARHTTPGHRLSATRHNWGAERGRFQTPNTYITAVVGWTGTRRYRVRPDVRNLRRRVSEVHVSFSPSVQSGRLAVWFGIVWKLRPKAKKVKPQPW